MVTGPMDAPVRNKWLADLLIDQRDLITQYWIEDIRAEDIPGYETITDEQLRQELPSTIDSMIYAFQTGDTSGPRQHSMGVIRHRLAGGFLLPDLQMSLHALQTAVMRIVRDANVGASRELEALYSSSTMYYLVALIAAGVYEQLRAEQQKRFAAAYEFGTTLSRTLDLDVILDASVRRVAELMNAESVAILLPRQDTEGDEVRAQHNMHKEVIQAMPGICESLGCAAVDAESQDVRKTAGNVADVRADEGIRSWATLLQLHGHLSLVYAPLLAKQRRLGSLVITWSDVHVASTSELDFLFAIAGHIANAVQNAVLYEDAQGKRELGVLLEASRLFASSLDTQDILSKTARMASEAVRADVAVVFAQDHLRGLPGQIAYHASGAIPPADVRQVIDMTAPEGDDSVFASFERDLADSKPILVTGRARFPGRLRTLGGPARSGLVVPLRHKGVVLGALLALSMRREAFRESDLILATGLGDLAAVAIENSRLYEYQRNIAETLQRSFLPSTLPDVAGYEVAAYYRPAMAEAAIGGDFYDVFISAESSLSIVIGDVSGKGLQAAIPTAMGKYMIRAYASEDPLPSKVLARFNRTFCESIHNDLFMTVFHASLDLKSHVLTYASAGHDPPLLYSAKSGQVRQVRAQGMCLGIDPAAEYLSESVLLQPGDLLLMYTDGATDVKREGRRLYVEGLQDLLIATGDGPVEETVRNLSNAILEYSGGKLADDVALVVLKRLDQ